MLKWILRNSVRNRKTYKNRPLSSEALQGYLRLRKYPAWTAFYLRYKQVQDDHFGRSHFNFLLDGKNYRVLRTGAFPFVKYHCTLAPAADLVLEDKFYSVLKAVNLGIPCLGYGIAGWLLAKHVETATFWSKTANREVTVELRFWYEETW